MRTNRVTNTPRNDRSDVHAIAIRLAAMAGHMPPDYVAAVLGVDRQVAQRAIAEAASVPGEDA